MMSFPHTALLLAIVECATLNLAGWILGKWRALLQKLCSASAPSSSGVSSMVLGKNPVPCQNERRCFLPG